MENKFISILRNPDISYGATEDTPFRFEEKFDGSCSSDVKYDYTVCGNSAKITVYPSGSPVKYLKLRFGGRLDFAEKVYGDQRERAGGASPLEWKSLSASNALPWFCYIIGNGRMACYGVKTGADCFASWYVDPHGITLFLDLCCGSEGTDLSEPLIACEVTEMLGEAGEAPYKVANRFSKLLCPTPVLPNEPIFGVNNWYWAYGRIDRKTVEIETDQLMRMCRGTRHRPYMIIDDGWQINRTYGEGAYIGDPWLPSDRFGDMTETAKMIHSKGAKAGLWFRPLLSKEDIPEEAVLAPFRAGGVLLDPSHPFVLEKMERDASRIRGWGYDLIKHDFSTMDFFGSQGINFVGYQMYLHKKQPYDKTKTNATIIKNMYKAIQRGAGGADIIGCNAVGHLCAGIHSVYRVGNDTSGRSFEWTRRQGVSSVMRLPLNDTFYRADPDCAAFTSRVDPSLNLDFLEMCAITGMTTLASVTPDILTPEEMKRINEIFLIADRDESRYGIRGYDKCSEPYAFESEDGSDLREFDWESAYGGSRVVYEWLN